MLDLTALSSPPSSYDPQAAALPPLTFPADLPAWEDQRSQLRALWEDYLGRGPAEPPPLDLQTETEEDLGEITRVLVSYQVELGCRVQAYLLRPQGDEPRPGVVVFHPTTHETILQPAGLAPPPEKHFGLKLARRGYVALCPRNYLWDYRGHPGPERDFAAFKALVEQELLGRYPRWTGMGKMVWDGRRAVDALLTVPGVDHSRLGCVGHSLGAKEVLYALAFDERLRAGVSSEGGLGIPFSNWDAPWYLGKGIHQRPDLQHHQLLALAAPRALLVLGGGLHPEQLPPDRPPGADPPEDWNYMQAARPPGLQPLRSRRASGALPPRPGPRRPPGRRSPAVPMARPLPAMLSEAHLMRRFALALLLLAASPAAAQTTTDRDLLFQLPTLDALRSGLDDGTMTRRQLRLHGDFGLGTFNALDGEMIVLDGRVYRVTTAGEVRAVSSGAMTPFAAATPSWTTSVLVGDTSWS